MNYKIPFELMSKSNSCVYIYGAGVVGRKFQQQIANNGNITILGFLDSFVTNENTDYDIVRKIGVHKPDILIDAEFDYVIIACSYKLNVEICWNLFNLGVPYEKILLGVLYSDRNSTPDIKSDWDGYYKSVEILADSQLERYIMPIVRKYDIPLDNCLDFPSGRGRISESFLKTYSEKVQSLICCDSNEEAIRFCKERFISDKRVQFSVNKISSWKAYPLDFSDSFFSFIFSWDAMVHFSYKWLDYYIGEFYRILQPGGFVFIHHSNLASPDVTTYDIKDELWSANQPHCRALITKEDVEYISKKYGFYILEQEIIDWGIPNLDCISILKKF